MSELRQEHSEAKSKFAALRIEHLYYILAVAAFSVMVALVPFPPHDFWFHLRAGRLHSAVGRVLQVDTFSWSIPPNTPYLYGSWFGEWLHYQIYALGGLQLTVFTRNVLATVAIALIGLEARWRSDSWRLAGLAVALSGLISVNNTVVRPQNFAWVPFALFFVILSRYAAHRLQPLWLLFLPALMIFWSNAHGTFALGYVMLALFAIGETLRRLLRHTGALTWPRIGAIYAVGLITVLVTVINPRGVGAYAYFVNTLGNESVQELVIEWQPPTPSGLINVTFFASILMLFGALAFGRRKPTVTDVLVISAFLWLAWDAGRNLMWYSMVAMPVLAQCLAAPHGSVVSTTNARQILRLNWAVAGFLTLAVLLAQPWTVRTLPMPGGYHSQMVPPPAPPLIATSTPFFAAEYIRANPGGKLFNELGYGSYLIWAVPKQKVFIDPRFELYPAKQWQDYVDMSLGHHSVELLKKYGANRVLLSREQQPKLSQALAAAQDWKREYVDNWSEIWTYTGRE